MRNVRHLLLLTSVLLLAGCDDVLDVPNENSPDRDRVLATAADLEQFIVNSWVTQHQGTIGGGNDALMPQMRTMALENFSELANFQMGPRGGIPRNPIDNFRGAAGQAGNYRDFLVLSRAARSASLGLAQLAKPGFTIGSAALDARARAFAYLVLGVATGNLSLSYDSVAIASPNDLPEETPPLLYYTDVNAAALRYLDSAIAIATASPASFPLPANWVNTSATTSQADFIRIVRTHKARLRAAVARTPAERAAADWAAIIADAENGITANLNMMMSPTLGWDVSWIIQHYVPGGWHRMHGFMIGMADTSGQYDVWLSTPRTSKVQFVIATPDRRFPRGTDRTAQQNTPTVTSPLPAGQYFRNRPPGDDILGDPLGNSMYDHYRFKAFFDASRIGAFPVITKAEMDLLAAEGYLRTAQIAMATAKIDIYRTAAGLPALTGVVTNTTTPVPGGNACVPRVPQAPNFTSSACGNVWEALKWEKRMETAYTGYGNWYFDSRGWGDLAQGTAIHWPVPWQEMDTRRQTFYSLGGVGSPSGTGPSTYGL